MPHCRSHSPLGWTARRDDVAAVRALIRAGADVNAQNNLGRTALMMTTESRHALCAKHLIDAGADLCMGDHRGYTALHFACRTGKREVVRMLLAKGSTARGSRRREAVSGELRSAFQALQRSVAVANSGRESVPDGGADDDDGDHDDTFFDASG
jgi:ankyrin repeat protein